jgi:hypothetical protein
MIETITKPIADTMSASRQPRDIRFGGGGSPAASAQGSSSVGRIRRSVHGAGAAGPATDVGDVPDVERFAQSPVQPIDLVSKW